MSLFYDILQQIVDLSDEEKYSLIMESYLELLPLFREADPQTRGLSLISQVIGTAATADKVVDSPDMKIMKAVMTASDINLSDEQVQKLIQEAGTDDNRRLVKKISHELDPELRARLVMLAAAVCSLDNRISQEEIDMIASMMD